MGRGIPPSLCVLWEGRTVLLLGTAGLCSPDLICACHLGNNLRFFFGRAKIRTGADLEPLLRNEGKVWYKAPCLLPGGWLLLFPGGSWTVTCSPCPVHTFWDIASVKLKEIFGTREGCQVFPHPFGPQTKFCPRCWTVARGGGVWACWHTCSPHGSRWDGVCLVLRAPEAGPMESYAQTASGAMQYKVSPSHNKMYPSQHEAPPKQTRRSNTPTNLRW